MLHLVDPYSRDGIDEDTVCMRDVSESLIKLSKIVHRLEFENPSQGEFDIALMHVREMMGRAKMFESRLMKEKKKMRLSRSRQR